MAEVVSGLLVGQRFNSLEEFKSVIRSISVRQHWDLKVVRSNKKSVVLGCRSSPNCYFRVVCRANKHATYITSLQDTHSCRRNLASPGATPARSEASHVRFLLNEIPKLFDLNKSKIKGQEVVEAVKRYHGYDISMRQAQRALTKLQPRQSRSQGKQSGDREGSASQDQSAPSSAVRTGTDAAFDTLADDRWPDHGLSSALIGDASMDQDASTPDSASSAVVPSAPHTQQLPGIHAHAQPSASEQRPISTRPHPPPPINTLPPPGSVYAQTQSQPTQLPLPPSTLKRQSQSHHPPPQIHQPVQTGHPASAQLVLTNFKIEFTCTSCGNLNQSFFPNQGNVTGNNYLPPHHLSAQSDTRSQTMTAVANEGAANTTAASFDDEYPGNAAANSRTISAWGGNIDVPMNSTNG